MMIVTKLRGKRHKVALATTFQGDSPCSNFNVFFIDKSILAAILSVLNSTCRNSRLRGRRSPGGHLGLGPHKISDVGLTVSASKLGKIISKFR
jgi:hypothetical protein